ncbi:MAG: hypothetical protein AAF222_01890 [Pseudomonadota bacterium]
MEALSNAANAILNQLFDVLSYPLLPSRRVFWLYLVTSVIVAYFVYRSVKGRGEHATQRDREAAQGSFLQFLFPKSVWSHPSAWLDVRYFFFHRTVSFFLLLGLGGAATAAAYHFVSGGHFFDLLRTKLVWTQWEDWAIALGFMVIVMLVLDFTGWLAHFMQHKVPFRDAYRLFVPKADDTPLATEENDPPRQMPAE